MMTNCFSVDDKIVRFLQRNRQSFTKIKSFPQKNSIECLDNIICLCQTILPQNEIIIKREKVYLCLFDLFDNLAY